MGQTNAKFKDSLEREYIFLQNPTSLVDYPPLISPCNLQGMKDPGEMGKILMSLHHLPLSPNARTNPEKGTIFCTPGGNIIARVSLKHVLLWAPSNPKKVRYVEIQSSASYKEGGDTWAGDPRATKSVPAPAHTPPATPPSSSLVSPPSSSSSSPSFSSSSSCSSSPASKPSSPRKSKPSSPRSPKTKSPKNSFSSRSPTSKLMKSPSKSLKSPPKSPKTPKLNWSPPSKMFTKPSSPPKQSRKNSISSLFGRRKGSAIGGSCDNPPMDSPKETSTEKKFSLRDWSHPENRSTSPPTLPTWESRKQSLTTQETEPVFSLPAAESQPSHSNRLRDAPLPPPLGNDETQSPSPSLATSSSTPTPPNLTLSSTSSFSASFDSKEKLSSSTSNLFFGGQRAGMTSPTMKNRALSPITTQTTSGEKEGKRSRNEKDRKKRAGGMWGDVAGVTERFWENGKKNYHTKESTIGSTITTTTTTSGIGVFPSSSLSAIGERRGNLGGKTNFLAMDLADLEMEVLASKFFSGVRSVRVSCLFSLESDVVEVPLKAQEELKKIVFFMKDSNFGVMTSDPKSHSFCGFDGVGWVEYHLKLPDRKMGIRLLNLLLKTQMIRFVKTLNPEKRGAAKAKSSQLRIRRNYTLNREKPVQSSFSDSMISLYEFCGEQQTPKMSLSWEEYVPSSLFWSPEAIQFSEYCYEILFCRSSLLLLLLQVPNVPTPFLVEIMGMFPNRIEKQKKEKGKEERVREEEEGVSDRILLDFLEENIHFEFLFNESSQNSIFRGESIASRLVATHISNLPRNDLDNLLNDFVLFVLQPGDTEIEGDRLPPNLPDKQETISQNKQRLLERCDRFLELTNREEFLLSFSNDIAVISYFIQRFSSRYLGNSGHGLIGGLIILRIVSPFITNYPGVDKSDRRKLILISKVIQYMSNNTTATSESFRILDDYIETNSRQFFSFFDKITKRGEIIWEKVKKNESNCLLSSPFLFKDSQRETVLKAICFAKSRTSSLSDNRRDLFWKIVLDEKPRHFQQFYSWVTMKGKEFSLPVCEMTKEFGIEFLDHLCEKFVFYVTFPGFDPLCQLDGVSKFCLPISKNDQEIVFSDSFATPLKVLPSSVICASNDPPGRRALYFLISGTVRVDYEIKTSRTSSFAETISVGSIFGHLSFFSFPHRTTIVYTAQKECVILKKTYTEISNCFKQSHFLFSQLFSSFCWSFLGYKKSLLSSLSSPPTLQTTFSSSSSSSSTSSSTNQTAPPLSSSLSLESPSMKTIGSQTVLLQFPCHIRKWTEGKTTIDIDPSTPLVAYLTSDFLYFYSATNGFLCADYVKFDQLNGLKTRGRVEGDLGSCAKGSRTVFEKDLYIAHGRRLLILKNLPSERRDMIFEKIVLLWKKSQWRSHVNFIASPKRLHKPSSSKFEPLAKSISFLSTEIKQGRSFPHLLTHKFIQNIIKIANCLSFVRMIKNSSSSSSIIKNSGAQYSLFGSLKTIFLFCVCKNLFRDAIVQVLGSSAIVSMSYKSPELISSLYPDLCYRVSLRSVLVTGRGPNHFEEWLGESGGKIRTFKFYCCDSPFSDPGLWKSFCYEVSIHNLLSHPNVTPCIECSLSSELEEKKDLPSFYFYTFPYYERGTLESLLEAPAQGVVLGQNEKEPRKKNLLTKEVGVAMLTDLIDAMIYLHNLHILHRNLTPGNIYINSNWRCSIGGIKMKHSLEPPYCAPEVMRGAAYSEKADVFAFGFLIDVIGSLFGSSFVSSKDDQFAQLTKGCWESDPNSRPSFEDLKSSLTSDSLFPPLEEQSESNTSLLNFSELGNPRKSRYDSLRTEDITLVLDFVEEDEEDEFEFEEEDDKGEEGEEEREETEKERERETQQQQQPQERGVIKKSTTTTTLQQTNLSPFSGRSESFSQIRTKPRDQNLGNPPLSPPARPSRPLSPHRQKLSPPLSSLSRQKPLSPLSKSSPFQSSSSLTTLRPPSPQRRSPSPVSHFPPPQRSTSLLQQQPLLKQPSPSLNNSFSSSTAETLSNIVSLSSSTSPSLSSVPPPPLSSYSPPPLPPNPSSPPSPLPLPPVPPLPPLPFERNEISGEGRKTPSPSSSSSFSLSSQSSRASLPRSFFERELNLDSDLSSPLSLRIQHTRILLFILKSRVAFFSFKLYLERCAMVEVTLLYQEILEFLSVSNESERILKAKEIYDSFLRRNSPFRVNLKPQTISNIQNALHVAKNTESSLPLYLFDAAEVEIFLLMRASIPSYLSSEIYRRYTLDHGSIDYAALRSANLDKSPLAVTLQQLLRGEKKVIAKDRKKISRRFSRGAHLHFEVEEEEESALPQLQPELMAYLWSDLPGFYSHVSLPTFSSPSPSDFWRDVAKMMELDPTNYPAGLSILCQGQFSPFLYYIESGVCRVFHEGGGSSTGVVEGETLSCGQFFGEIGFLRSYFQYKSYYFSSAVLSVQIPNASMSSLLASLVAPPHKPSSVSSSSPSPSSPLGPTSQGSSPEPLSPLPSSEGMATTTSSSSSSSELERWSSHVTVVADTCEPVSLFKIRASSFFFLCCRSPSLEAAFLSLVATQLTCEVLQLTDRCTEMMVVGS